MAQVKIYGIADRLEPIKSKVSDAIHEAVVEALELPVEKRAQRFFPMPRENFIVPGGEGRTDQYTIIEINMFEGRSAKARRCLIRLLFQKLQAQAGICPADVEITITELPRGHCGFCGQPGDAIRLEYAVEV